MFVCHMHPGCIKEVVPRVSSSVVATITLQPLLQVIQAWQDCLGAYRSMLFGMSVALGLMHHIISHCYGDPSDHPIGDPDVAHLP